MIRDLFGCGIPLAFSMMLTAQHIARADDPLVFVSAFAAGDEGAIHAYRLDLASGELTLAERTTDVEHPFFLAVSPNNQVLYSIHTKNFGGAVNDHIAAFKVSDATGQLTRLNQQSALGTAACYLDVDASNRTVVVANYSSGSVASLPIHTDGSLGEATTFVQHEGSSVDPMRQKGPHAHCIVVSPDNRFAYAADLGLDQVLAYRLDAAASTLSPLEPPFVTTPAGAGPRHLIFHPNGKHVYVINELANSVTLFDHDPDYGTLTERQTISTLPQEFDGTSHCADLKITPDGQFLYGTNRGHDSIAAYRIGEDGSLTLLRIVPSLGKGPQNLAIAPGGNLLLCANMPGNNVAVFRIDRRTGDLSSVGEPIEMTSPSCIKFLSVGSKH